MDYYMETSPTFRREGQMQDKEEMASFTGEDFALFYEVSTSIHAVRDLDAMLRIILRKIKAAFRVEGASIALHDAERKEFYFIRTVEEERNGDRESMKRMRFPDHLGVAGWVLRENRPVIIPDVSRDNRFFKGLDLQESFVTQSMICLPLRTREGPIGVLYALNKLQGKFTPREARLLEILSGTIAIALENARLYTDLKQNASSLEQENRLLKSEVQGRFNLQGIIGSSPAMRRIFALLDKVVDTTTSVLIDGETGTGKELIARVIHYNGPLKDKPFLAENCGALSENLLESELFGHVRGAFTGAVADKKGLFELAHGGTVFLDEIGETPLLMQVKLLRVLQEGEIRPVGGSRYRKIVVRLIASTNRNLEEEVRKGNFREDLFYRIDVFRITLPPLRERREDIPLLADHFLRKFGRKLKRPTARLTPLALDFLTRFDWPGNVRELENEIERALTLAGRKGEIREEHLSSKISATSERGLPFEARGATLKEVTERMERRMVLETLQKTKGNRSRAAKILGLTRQGLLNKIARYNIDQ
jgi:Nif-specific regulatory protein